MAVTVIRAVLLCAQAVKNHWNATLRRRWVRLLGMHPSATSKCPASGRTTKYPVLHAVLVRQASDECVRAAVCVCVCAEICLIQTLGHSRSTCWDSTSYDHRHDHARPMLSRAHARVVAPRGEPRKGANTSHAHTH